MRKYLVKSMLAGALSFGVLGGASLMAQAPHGGAAPGGEPQAASRPSNTDVNNPNAQTGSAKPDDKKFAKEAAIGGLAEVELGKVATQKASSDAVKQFGQKMVDDHTKANDQLKQVASQENIDLPTSLDKKHQAMVAKMSAMSGPAFDKAYVKDMVKDHEKDVREFQAEANGGQDPNIKDFASKTLPVLQDHLQSIKQIQTQMSGK